LNEIVTAGACPWWLTDSSVVDGLYCAMTGSGARAVPDAVPA